MVQRVEVPAALTSPCAIVSLPEYGITWVELLGIIAEKHYQQLQCNEQVKAIRQFSEGGN